MRRSSYIVFVVVEVVVAVDEAEALIVLLVPFLSRPPQDGDL